uniref:non-specific serine/threonine protein kinase n=1 Tax=Eutreptiella gymnastica TaxID=73025 RepID=A0A7S1HZ40_9EUGL|mmetsp:Transcript_116368/g.202347  ORF Transcript_116368/g.202347 Transcript_116368/m.202347 type:complete len:665 (+) Transcript_116368:78-2072(+)
MAVVREGWLKKGTKPKKIVGVRLKSNFKPQYVVLKSNGELWICNEPPNSDSIIYSQSRSRSHSRAGSPMGSPTTRDSTASEDPSLDNNSSSFSLRDGLLTAPGSMAQLPVAHAGELNATQDLHFEIPLDLPKEELQGEWCTSVEMCCSGVYEGPPNKYRHHPPHLPEGQASPEDTELSSSPSVSPPSQSSPQIPRSPLGSPTRSGPVHTSSVTRQMRKSLSERSRSPGSIITTTLAGFLSRTSSASKVVGHPQSTMVRLDRAVVTGLTDERISIVTNELEKQYVFQAETTEEKLQWIEDLQRVCSRFLLGLNDFLIQKCVGAGGFGKVYKVRMKHNNRVFAMKVMEKAYLYDKDAVDEVINEVNFMQSLKHPYIVRMYCSFQTGDKLYMLMDFLSGGELFTLMQKGGFPAEVMSLYTAEMALALNYLHEQDIIYRDLKPENVVLDSEGHCVLTDFGLAHKRGQEALRPEGVVAGSPTYMSPELLMTDTPLVTKAADWWALGCLAFEVTTGIHPFLSDDNEVEVLTICTKEPVLDVEVKVQDMMEELKDLVKRFLIKDPLHRLQNLNTIKQHPFFAGIDWEAVARREVPPTLKGLPWKPRVSEQEKFDADVAAESTVWEEDTEQPLEFLEGFGFCDTELLRDTHLRVESEKKNKFKLVQDCEPKV